MPQLPRPLLTALALVCALACARPAPAQAERHLRLGNPSGATQDRSNNTNFLMAKEWFALSYNNAAGTPNWVSWHLVKDDFGDAPRENPFAPDAELPAGFHRVRPADYKFSATAFQRGHLCPKADRDKTAERAAATFVMTNMVPQTAELNTGAWAQLEAYCRKLVEGDGKELYVVAGPAGKGGWSAKGYFNSTDGWGVVPAKCWKVVLVLDAGKGTRRRG